MERPISLSDCYLYKYFELIDYQKNSFKFYEVIQEHATSDYFIVIWGRIGTKGQIKTYPKYMLNDKVYEKIRKGYKDKTEKGLQTRNILNIIHQDLKQQTQKKINQIKEAAINNDTVFFEKMDEEMMR